MTASPGRWGECGVKERVLAERAPNKYSTTTARASESRDPGATRDRAIRPCWGGRPPTASLCQNEAVIRLVVEASNKGAVRDEHYPHWHRYVQECFSIAWSRYSRKADLAQEIAAIAAS